MAKCKGVNNIHVYVVHICYHHSPQFKAGVMFFKTFPCMALDRMTLYILKAIVHM